MYSESLIAEDYLAGMKISDLSKKHNIGLAKIYIVLKRQNIPRRRDRIDKQLKRHIVRRLKLETPLQVAADLGLPYWTVYNIGRRHV